MERIANNDSAFLPYLYNRIGVLPSNMQKEVLLFTDFLISKSMMKSYEVKIVDFDETTNDNHFANLSLSSLSKEWDSDEDKEWDTLLAQMPSIQ
jgi:hypothetical protein